MNAAITFDTLQHAKRAREVGFTEQQAEFQAEELARIIQEQNTLLATKEDLANGLKRLEEHLTYKLTMRFGFMAVAIISILTAIIKL